MGIGTDGGGMNCLRYDERGKTVLTYYTITNSLSHEVVRLISSKWITSRR